MQPDNAASKRKFKLAIEATQTGKILFSGADSIDQFDRGCDHAFGILHDAYLLFKAGSFSTVVFLAITAIEEIAKLEIAVFRNEQQTAQVKRRRDDHLFSHKAKHSIALQEVIAIGTRLPEAIGEQRVRDLLDMAESGKLVALRESALYTDNIDGEFVCPADRIDKNIAREILLLSLEVWDDRLVGLTNHTYELNRELVDIFNEVAGS